MNAAFSRYVLVVDDEPVIRTLVGEILTSKGFSVELASNAQESLAILEEVAIDVAIVDLDLGQSVSGVDLVHILSDRFPEVACVVLTNFPDLAAAGLVDGSFPPNVPVVDKRTVTDSNILIDSLDRAIEGSGIRHALAVSNELALLTSGQLRTLRMLAQGYKVPEIARISSRSVSAVEKMVRMIYRKLKLDERGDLNQRTEAVRLYVDAFGLPSRGEGASSE